MANYKVIDADQLDSDLTSVADSIRTKGGTTAALAFPEEFKAAIEAIEAGGGGGGAIVPVSPKAVNFRDYDGTVLYSYTAEEAVALTELPPLPTQPGLVCQGWNFELKGMKSYVTKYRRCEIGAIYITDNGKTRIHITLNEGRTSPTLNLCLDGTAVVDWGDGTDLDEITGADTYTVVHTRNHQYAQPGNYVIEIAVSGTLNIGVSGLLSRSSEESCDTVYLAAIKKIEIGQSVSGIDLSVGGYASLSSITIPEGITGIPTRAFVGCNSLTSIAIPYSGYSIAGDAFYQCRALASIAIGENCFSMGGYIFQDCSSLTNITIPEYVFSIEIYCFCGCRALTSIAIPADVYRLGDGAFLNCDGVKFYDFTQHSEVPTLGAYVFDGNADDFEIRVPASLYNQWKAATNWSAYASHIVGV